MYPCVKMKRPNNSTFKLLEHIQVKEVSLDEEVPDTIKHHSNCISLYVRVSQTLPFTSSYRIFCIHG